MWSAVSWAPNSQCSHDLTAAVLTHNGPIQYWPYISTVVDQIGDWGTLFLPAELFWVLMDFGRRVVIVFVFKYKTLGIMTSTYGYMDIKIQFTVQPGPCSLFITTECTYSIAFAKKWKPKGNNNPHSMKVVLICGFQPTALGKPGVHKAHPENQGTFIKTQNLQVVVT